MSGSLQVCGVVTRGGFEVTVDVQVAAGEVLVVLGPNGSGKTSLLRAVAGLESLSHGHIRLDGRLLDDAHRTFVPAEQRSVGLVFQDYRLFAHLRVLDNVAFGARCAGTGRRQAREQAQKWLDRLELTDLAGRRPAQLSGGQAQRVALARALAAQPAALLLDEPLAALDVRTRQHTRLALRSHLVGFDGPVVLVTHDPVEAMALADRLLVLEAGRVVQLGTAQEVARRPSTDYVARMVGLNLYAGRLSSADGLVLLDDGGRLRGTWDGNSADLALAGQVLVAVAPSAVSLSRQPPVGSARNVWPGVIQGLEPVQGRVRVHVAGAPSMLVDVTPAAVAELKLLPGEQVWLSAKAVEVAVYPA